MLFSHLTGLPGSHIWPLTLTDPPHHHSDCTYGRRGWGRSFSLAPTWNVIINISIFCRHYLFDFLCYQIYKSVIKRLFFCLGLIWFVGDLFCCFSHQFGIYVQMFSWCTEACWCQKHSTVSISEFLFSNSLLWKIWTDFSPKWFFSLNKRSHVLNVVFNVWPVKSLNTSSQTRALSK